MTTEAHLEALKAKHKALESRLADATAHASSKDQELAEIRLQVFRGIQGLLGMFNRASYVNQTTRGADHG